MNQSEFYKSLFFDKNHIRIRYKYPFFMIQFPTKYEYTDNSENYIIDRYFTKNPLKLLYRLLKYLIKK